MNRKKSGVIHVYFQRVMIYFVNYSLDQPYIELYSLAFCN